MKKTIALLLGMVMILTLIAVPLIAGAQSIRYGDADGDGNVTILDATRIQRHLASYDPPISEEDMKAARVSGNEELSIIDATLVQRYIADIITVFPAEEITPEPATEEETGATEPEPTEPSKDTLVVVFSRTGNTRPLAQYAAAYLDADLFEIEAAVPYTDADIAYYTNCRADREQSDPAARPAIANTVENMEQYSTVVIAYPIWHGQAPKIIYTFLEGYDFAGKTVIPFCTSASSPLGSSASNLHSLAPNATWKDGRRFAAGTSQQTIEAWLKELGY